MMNPHFHTDFSISDSLIFVRKSVLIYETIIMSDSSEIDCNRLFDRFYTGDKSRHNGSTGLGLAVVKTLVAILGGNIVAKVHANSLIITLKL